MLLLVSCGSAEKKSDLASADSAIAIVENTEQPVEPVKVVDTTLIFGAYVGEFRAEEYKEDRDITYTNVITLFLDSIVEKRVYGRSVVAGNNTPFSGEIAQTGPGTYSAEVREPGDNKYDGMFRFDIDSMSRELKGTWTANDTSLGVTKRAFELKKRQFAYDPKLTLPEHIGNYPIGDAMETTEGEADQSEFTTTDALKFNASTTLLKAKDVENMKRGDLEVIRNAIYARHGYSFRNRKMRYVFDAVEWYMPVTTDIRAELTDIEKQNIALLKRYEEHAEKYYDYFGR